MRTALLLVSSLYSLVASAAPNLSAPEPKASPSLLVVPERPRLEPSIALLTLGSLAQVVGVPLLFIQGGYIPVALIGLAIATPGVILCLVGAVMLTKALEARRAIDHPTSVEPPPRFQPGPSGPSDSTPVTLMTF